MNRIREMLKGRTGGMVLCALEILVGVLLLIDPMGFTGSIIVGAGAVMALCGIVSALRYFTVKPEAGAAGQLLFRGLLLMMAGLVCVTQVQWILTAFPLLTVIYAGWMLVLAAMKVQQMADMLRLKAGRWYMPAIAAGVAAVLATVILINPFGAANVVWNFAGISLIAEAVVELVGALLK